jgi:hypothetical protein
MRACRAREPHLKRGPDVGNWMGLSRPPASRAQQIPKGAGRKWHGGCGQIALGAEVPVGSRRHGKLCRSTRSPVAGPAPRGGCRHIGRRGTNENGRGRGAGAFLAQVRSGCGAGARHLAVVACRRSGCRFQGKGMNEHLVANVARCDRPVENWRHRVCHAHPWARLARKPTPRSRTVDGRDRANLMPRPRWRSIKANLAVAWRRRLRALRERRHPYFPRGPVGRRFAVVSRSFGLQGQNAGFSPATGATYGRYRLDISPDFGRWQQMSSPLQMAHCGAGDIAAGAVWGICYRGAFEIT